MKISREQVMRVAELAHLDLSEAEVELYSRQLDHILGYIEKLNQLDTSGVEPMAQVFSGVGNEENVTARADEVVRSDAAEAILAIAPDPSRPYFRVPKVIEK
jgi:aspartyl-tRNA(Asn)/glutamyl-tRNA(Gln) amidotransferase subunit C